MIDINVTLLIQVGNFLLLMAGLNRLLLRPLLRVMDEREARIQHLKREAITLRQARAREEKAYEERLDQERAAAVPLRLQAIAEAYERYREIMADAREAADRRLREQTAQLDVDREAAWKTLEAEIPSLTENLVDRLIADEGRPS